MGVSDVCDVMVLGPSSWNTMLVLESLPSPHPHMVVAQESWDTVGGTSAGKALHLEDLGVPTRLMTPVADDEAGRRVRAALAALTVDHLPTTCTERHVNLMTRSGDRLSIYAAPPATTAVPDPRRLRNARAVVLDLAPWTRELAETLVRTDLPIWADVHDIGDEAPWHEPFLRVASYVQCSADKLSNPLDFLRSCVAGGARLAVCTLGAQGAIAVDPHGEYRVSSTACDVLDTNGAGDAFFAGVLSSSLEGAPVERALDCGSRQAVRALTTRDLGPGLC